MAALRFLSQPRFCGIIFLIAATGLAAIDIRVDSEYDFFLDDGQTLSKVKILESGPLIIRAQVGGLAEEIKIPRKAIRSAKLLVKKPFFSAWEVALFGDAHLAQGDLTLLAKFFPMAAINVTAHLRKRNKYIGVNALNAETNYLFATDGERQIHGIGFALGPRWYFNGPQFNWVVGAGGGMTGLYLKSYNFTRTSYAGMAFLETGIVKDLGKKIRLYALVRANYWSDTQVVLGSLGVRLGAGYVW
jgi:hypothetical protein